MGKPNKTNNTRSFKNRLLSAYFTTIVSISFVLFLLGFVGLLVLNANRLSDYVKENIGFTVCLKDNVKETDIIRLQKELDATEYIKSTEYIPKDRAAREFSEDLGEDFVSFLDYNPLLASIEVKLYANYANPDSIVAIESSLQNFPQVKEIYYQRNLVDLVNKNIKKISFYILIFSALLFFVSVVLINNTIRLSIYSKRFIINTMQLVGATNSFIRQPLLLKSMVQGIVGGVIAIFLLLGIINFAQGEFSGVINFNEYEMLTLLFLSVIVIGILISGGSALFAINKYLRMKADDLYY